MTNATMTRKERREAFAELLAFITEMENGTRSLNFRDADLDEERTRKLQTLVLKSEGVRHADVLIDHIETEDTISKGEHKLKRSSVNLRKLESICFKHYIPAIYRKAGLSSTSFYNKLNGITRFTYFELEKVASAINCDIMELIVLEGETKK